MNWGHWTAFFTRTEKQKSKMYVVFKSVIAGRCNPKEDFFNQINHRFWNITAMKHSVPHALMLLP